jgi:hypothetical protein
MVFSVVWAVWVLFAVGAPLTPLHGHTLIDWITARADNWLTIYATANEFLLALINLSLAFAIGFGPALLARWLFVVFSPPVRRVH